MGINRSGIGVKYSAPGFCLYFVFLWCFFVITSSRNHFKTHLV
jgi:hypothetical protein